MVYRITDAGRDEVATWFTTPVAAHPAAARRAGDQAGAGGHRARASTSAAVIQQQRTATMRALQDYTRLKRAGRPTTPSPADMAWILVLDSLVFAAEAEVRWLDHCEARLRRAALATRTHRAPRTHRARPPRRRPDERHRSNDRGACSSTT